MKLSYRGRKPPKLSKKQKKAREAGRKRAGRGVARNATGCRNPLGVRLEPAPRPKKKEKD